MWRRQLGEGCLTSGRGLGWICAIDLSISTLELRALASVAVKTEHGHKRWHDARHTVCARHTVNSFPFLPCRIPKVLCSSKLASQPHGE